MAITDSDIQRLVREIDQGRDAWIHGRLRWDDPKSSIRQAPDATIFGAFGGGARRGVAPLARPEGQRATAEKFRGGTGTTELVRAIVEGDLAVLVMVDRSRVNFDGYDGSRPWELRITEVFRRDADNWVRIHRHADPLTKFRDLDETLVLAAS